MTDSAAISRDVRTAIAEDLGDGDKTAELISEAQQLKTRVICREHAILCGRAWFDETFRQLDPAIHIDWRIDDGEPMSPDLEICTVEGPARAILSGERTALNFLQTLSGTATRTAQYVDAVSGTGVTILDTRKTIPGLRAAQKYAVLCGGGANHRVGLFDAILIKENHIAAAGSITTAVSQARANNSGLLIEVEVENLAQLAEAEKAGAERVLLDNFPVDLLAEAVSGYSGRIELEASGGITLESIREVAETGVDYISTGDITKHVTASDFSMRYI